MLEKLREFLKTKKGRIIALVIGGLIILLVVLLVLLFVLKGRQTTETAVVTKSPADSQTAEEEVEKEVKEDEAVSSEVDSFEVYEYKDPFEPLVSAPATTTAIADTTSTDTTDVGVLILVLEDIYTEDEVKYASIRYGSTVYKVTEGDRVNDSPYQVVSINIEEESVTLLYGEDLIEIEMGEEIIK